MKFNAELIQKTNWKKYKWCYIAHILQGVVSTALVPFPIAGWMLYDAYKNYQIVEYNRLKDRRDTEYFKKPVVLDTPSLDLQHNMIGMGIGVVFSLCWSIPLLLFII